MVAVRVDVSLLSLGSGLILSSVEAASRQTVSAHEVSEFEFLLFVSNAIVSWPVVKPVVFAESVMVSISMSSRHDDLVEWIRSIGINVALSEHFKNVEDTHAFFKVSE